MSNAEILARYSKILPGYKGTLVKSREEKFDPFAHVPYLPQKGKQQEFFECDADIVVFGGANAGGKSALSLLKALKGVSIPGYVAMVFRRTAKDILSQGSLWNKTKEFYRDIPGAVYRDSTQYLDWRFPPGSSISFGHADNLTQTKQGTELAYIAVDELANGWTQDEFLFLLSRNRTNCGVKPQFVGTCNPDCDSFLIKNPATGVWRTGSWLEWWIDIDGYPIAERSGVIRYFLRYNDTIFWADDKVKLFEEHQEYLSQVKGDIDPMDLIKSFTFIAANVYDNPAFIEANPGYLANLLMLDEVEKKRFLHGNWKVSDEVGIVFNPNNFQFIDESEVPDNGLTVRYWDFAAKEELDADPNSCFTASQKWKIVSVSAEVFNIYILHVFWEQTLDADSCVALAKEDGREVHVAWELEPGSASIKYASLLTKQLQKEVRGVQVAPMRSDLDKVARAKPWARAAKLGRVYVVRNDFWNGTLINSLIKFNGKKIPQITDIIDSGSGCYQWYINNYRKPSKPIKGTPKYKKVG
jgi:phage terminase large subunit-like protein